MFWNIIIHIFCFHECFLCIWNECVLCSCCFKWRLYQLGSQCCLDFLFPSVQFSCSVASNSLKPHGLQHTRPPCPSKTPGAYSTHVHQVDDAIEPSHPLSSPSPPTFSLSSIRVFSNELALHISWPKYWSFTFNISSPMNTQNWSPLGWTGWISLQSKGLKSLLQHHSSKASVLQRSAFFIV